MVALGSGRCAALEEEGETPPNDECGRQVAGTKVSGLISSPLLLIAFPAWWQMGPLCCKSVRRRREVLDRVLASFETRMLCHGATADR